MDSESFIHPGGSLPNASRTPRNEVGGLAVFEGVMMRSRTGFAMAMRRDDDAILVRQIPYASLVQRKKTFALPFFRGIASLGEMMVVGTKALQDSSSLSHGDGESSGRSEGGSRMAAVIGSSLVVMLFFFVFLPDLLASLLMGNVVLPWLAGGGDIGLQSDVDYPFTYNLLAGVFRLLILIVYIVSISLSSEVRRVFEYHGAEHKAVLALEEGRDVTVAQAMRHDTIHPRCGTTLLATLILLTVIVFALVDAILLYQVSGFPSYPYIQRKLMQTVAHALVLIPTVGLCFELLKYCAANWHRKWCRHMLWPGLALQRLTTRQPDRHQVEVAIVALFAALAIPSWQRDMRSYVVRGLEDDESAPGFVARSPARVASTENLQEAAEESAGEVVEDK